MCGLVGIFNVNGRPVSINTLKKMTDTISHRGPDGEGFWTDSFIGLGHRRLAIIDLSPLGHQPMLTDNSEAVIVYNGEVYNYENLRIELEAKGHTFRSRTDTEVLLKAFLEWGPDCVKKLNGMFAFAIWDNRNNSLLIARDRYGVKPLYYHYRNGVLAFASEIKALLKHTEISVRVCPQALDEYFSFQNVFSDHTLFDGIKLLPAGNTLTVHLGAEQSFRTKQYWDFNFYDRHSLHREEEYVEELDRLFTKAVTDQLVSDVEIGSYLSGGIDSGGITCIAAKNLGHIKSFTGGFDLSSASGLELGYDERDRAEFLSARYKTEHYEVILKAGDMERVMSELIYHLEDLRVGQSYPNYYVARLASKFVRVVLSGAGGDELFGGYPWRYYRAITNNSPEDYIDKYYRYWQRLIDDQTKQSFFLPEYRASATTSSTREIFGSVMSGKKPVLTSPEEYINWSLYFEAKTFLHGLLLVEDKLSMAHGLETRVPFLDNDLVDFAMKIPVQYKLRSIEEVIKLDENNTQEKAEKFFGPTNDGKLILRKVLARYVPEGYSNSVKQGFSAPDGSWFKGESIDYIRNLLLCKHARIYDYIERKPAEQMLNEHFSGKKNRRLFIWSLLCFEWWNKIFDPR